PVVVATKNAAFVDALQAELAAGVPKERQELVTALAGQVDLQDKQRSVSLGISAAAAAVHA
ncbi:MAG TPA: hypothetical protein VL588_13255, partial [Bdellovibrionota bacterium]|nr:hypothetical protein [Bdellovibrionota bacterium]